MSFSKLRSSTGTRIKKPGFFIPVFITWVNTLFQALENLTFGAVMPKLSIIMPFLNEGEEPLRTVESIYDTCRAEDVEIIAIDDGSDHHNTDFSPYPAVRMVRNNARMGVHASVRRGISLAQTDSILRIDGHMRFRNDGWPERFEDALAREPETIFCTTCVGLREGQMDLSSATTRYYGADILLVNTDTPDASLAGHILEPKWTVEKPGDEYEIPCVLGANYLYRKSWMEHLRGLDGLLKWGGEEVSMSLKTWMAGGRCKLLKDIEIGHRFRDRAPYTTEMIHLYMNKLWMCWTLFPEPIARTILRHLPNTPIKQIAEVHQAERLDEISEMQQHHARIFRHSAPEVFKRLNMHLPGV